MEKVHGLTREASLRKIDDFEQRSISRLSRARKQRLASFFMYYGITGRYHMKEGFKHAAT